MKIYCISGLGADKRVFRYLKVPNHELIFLDWISPLDSESLRDYATRLSSKINFSEDFSILGLSFGGMIGVEIAKVHRPKFLILISSVMVRREMPFLVRMASSIKLSPVVPMFFFNFGRVILYYFFGVKSTAEKNMLKAVMEDTDKKFLKWAIRAIIGWNNSDRVKALRIHGGNDKIIPVSKMMKLDLNINKGGHLIVLTHAKIISELILEKMN